MTEPTGDTGPILTQLAELTRVMKEGVEATMQATERAQSIEDRIETLSKRSDQRARTFRGMWTTLVVLLAAVVVTGVLIGLHIDKRIDCFRDYAVATAQRTQTLAAASDTRIRALNDVLDARAKGATNEQAQKLLAAAAAAGDAYEQIAKANPPVPANAATCATPPDVRG